MHVSASVSASASAHAWELKLFFLVHREDLVEPAKVLVH